MNLELVKEALKVADSILGAAVHSGTHFQTAAGKDDAVQARNLVKAALQELTHEPHSVRA
jgi:hypothetical protein